MSVGGGGKSAAELRAAAEAAAPEAHAWSGLLGSVLAYGELLPRTARHRKASGMAGLDAAARGQLLIEACEVRAAPRAASACAPCAVRCLSALGCVQVVRVQVVPWCCAGSAA
jgi:hypothetical protein